MKYFAPLTLVFMFFTASAHADDCTQACDPAGCGNVANAMTCYNMCKDKTDMVKACEDALGEKSPGQVSMYDNFKKNN